jgi:predicted nucleotidyltransferase
LNEMTTRHRIPSNAQRESPPTRWYRGADVPKSVIRRFARDVAERFHPEKIILFGSHAYGRPHADSDVDVLVIMPCRNQLDQAFKIHDTLRPPFPLHIVVRTPSSMSWRLAEGDSFLQEITSKGKVLYEERNAGVGAKGRKRLSSRRSNRGVE